jgi:hypothetical protein
MTTNTEKKYLFSPSFVEMATNILERLKGSSISLSQTELDNTTSHTDYINQVFDKILSFVDQRKWSKFCQNNSDKISFIYDTETRALNKKDLLEAEYYECLDKIMPIINSFEDQFIKCVKF